MSSLAISPSGRPMQFALRLFPWLIAASAALSAQTLQQPDTTFSDGSNKVACYKQLDLTILSVIMVSSTSSLPGTFNPSRPWPGRTISDS